MRLLVDGVFFQLADTGIARVWTSLLARIVGEEGLEILMLDRGRCPKIDGIRTIEFPSYTIKYTASDSLLIDWICRRHSIDVFASTYYTSATEVPQVQLVYDMIPEVLGFNLNERAWMEKQLAISFARRLVCISQNTRDDLLRFHPQIPPSHVTFAHCGVDRESFRPAAPAEIERFRRAHGIDRPYFMLVGSRRQHLGYKNASLFFRCLEGIEARDFDVLCFGGEEDIETDYAGVVPREIAVRRLGVSDPDLGIAYSGAIALVYPSLYEGFGMPVVEAMASGCPVITTKAGSLGEVSGDAALHVSGLDLAEMAQAVREVRDPARRAALVEAGLARAQAFGWDAMAAAFLDATRKACLDGKTEATRAFFARWSGLRTLQAKVDV